MSQRVKVRVAPTKRGFTVVEVIIAIMIMSVAVLAMATSSGLVAKMLLRAHNAEMASAFAGRRLDQLKLSGCTARANGADTLYRGGPNWAAVNNWTWADAGGSVYRVKITTTYRSSNGTIGTNVSESSISCIF
jgi:prepilin-type N-terminal cleavage/methylation domain-containing protein